MRIRFAKKAVILLYVAMLAVLGTATFLENAHGVDWAHRHIYGSWWFICLWAALVVAGIAYFVKMRVRRLPVITLHASLLIILLGALVSHLTGRSGTMHLRLYKPQNIVEITHNGQCYLHRLAYDVTLSDFEVMTDDDGNAVDFRSDFTIDGTPATVSMNKICRHGNLRFYQISYDDDLCGSTLAINRDPYGIPITYCGYALLFASLIAVCVGRSVSARLLLGALGLTLAWCIYYFVLDGSWSQIPVLRSPLLAVHVSTIIMAYALLLLQAVASAAWLLRNRKGEGGAVSAKSQALLRLSLCLLGIGIFLGAIWANISWGNYWSWDSKEVWALVTFMVYAIPAHRISLPLFARPKVYHAYMLAAFLVILMTYFGVNHFLSGMHSYA